VTARDGEESLSTRAGRDGRVLVLVDALADAVRTSVAGGGGGSSAVIDLDASDQNDTYSMDWLKQYRGAPPIAVLPRSTEQAARVLAHCSGRSIAVSPRAGNTGLAGAAAPVHDEIVLACADMDRVVTIDEDALTAEVAAGCVLEVFDGKLGECDPPLMAPLDLGSKGIVAHNTLA
jgi:FAD/FMN-containing dehydrogenase